MPAIGSAVKRKRSENDLAQYKEPESKGKSIKLKRVTIANPPRFTAQDYARSLEKIRPLADQAGPSNWQNVEGAQTDQHAEVFSSQPTLDKFYELYSDIAPDQRQNCRALTTPRAIHVNDEALNALEGNAPHDDGSRWRLGRRDRDNEIARGLEILLGENVSRTDSMAVSMEDADEPETFDREQQRTM